MLVRLLPLIAFYAHNVLAQESRASLGADGFIRFGCSQLVVERTDPLVTPGQIPSPHMQYVVCWGFLDYKIFFYCFVASSRSREDWFQVPAI
jgi:hypothetical protein